MVSAVDQTIKAVASAVGVTPFSVQAIGITDAILGAAATSRAIGVDAVVVAFASAVNAASRWATSLSEWRSLFWIAGHYSG